MQTRLFQYDALKALSIFLVILGHIFIYTFNQGDNTIVSFINVVNMGMFMFISGFFAGIPTFHGLKKRVRTLLLPTITVGLLYTCIKGGGIFESFLFNQIHLGYWFCLTLFLIYVIHLCSFYIGRGIAKRVKSGIIFDVCLILCVLALLLCYALFYHESVPGEALSIPMLCRFIPYYCYGVIIRNHDKIARLLQDNSIFTLSLLAMVGAFYMNPNSSANRLIIAFSYINMMVYAFTKWFAGSNSKVVSYVATRTIDIYLFHFFLIPTYFMAIPDSFVIDNNILLALAGTSILSAMVLSGTLILTRFIETSNFLMLVLLGKIKQ